MEEKILSTRKNGMAVLLGCIILELLSVFGFIVGIGVGPGILMVVSFIIMCTVLKPEEALVLTLFGNYTGTLKGPGFYAVNPFSVSVNPAKKTKLGQSGDVDAGSKGGSLASLISKSQSESSQISNVISLKIMTLNNSRQKVNDVLGNPVEIGVAVMWRVVDTAKAVFTVDNYKEYLSLQCDTAVRNIVKIYPYDMAPNVDTTGDGVADDGSLRGSRFLSRVLRSWMRESRILHMRRRSQPSCCRGSRHPRSSMQER